MGIRVNRRIKIAKGLSLNISKSGVSASAKVGRVTVNSRRGVTANVAKGVSVNVPMGKAKPRGKAVARPRAVAAAPVVAGPRTFRRPFGRVPGWLFWTAGVLVVVLLTAIPAAGGLLALLAIVALIVVWQVTPRQIEDAPPIESAAVTSPAETPVVPTADAAE